MYHGSVKIEVFGNTINSNRFQILTRLTFDLAVMWVVAYTADQSQICQETISMGCASYQPIEADETVCGTDGSRYNNL